MWTARDDTPIARRFNRLSSNAITLRDDSGRAGSHRLPGSPLTPCRLAASLPASVSRPSSIYRLRPVIPVVQQFAIEERAQRMVEHQASRGSGSTGLATAPDHDLQRAKRLTCALGLAFALLFVAALLTFTPTPKIGASDAEVVTFYETNSQLLIQVGGLYLLPLAAVAFLWFTAALREWVESSARSFDHLLSTVQMLSGVSFITLALAAAGAATIVSLSHSASSLPLDPSLARQFPLYGRTLLIVFGMRMAAIFVMSTANIGRGAHLFPRWFVFGSVAVAAILFLSATLNVWLVLVFPLWVLVLIALIWQRPAH